jgi:hypothetical protein
MVGTAFSPANFLQVGAQLSTDKYHTVEFGLMGALKLSIFNLYFSVNPLQNLFNANTYDYVSGQIGMSLMWGKND